MIDLKEAKYVAIVGTATSSVEMAPWQDLGADLWAVNSLHKPFPEASPRVDLWWEMHHDPGALHPDWWEWALEKQPPVVMQDVHPQMSRSVKYPLDEMKEIYGSYFTSSIAYMLALAIESGAKKIGLYGIDMALGTEYQHQRPCCEYFLGIAFGRGIDVEIPKYSELLKSAHLYGYHKEKPRTVHEKLADERAIWRAKAIYFEKEAKELRRRSSEKKYRKRFKTKRKRQIR